MPENRGQYLQLLVLLLALPAQYLLTHWYGANSDTLRIGNFQQMLATSKEVASKTEKLFGTVWHHFSSLVLFRLDTSAQKKLKAKVFSAVSFPNGESVAKDVFKYQSSDGYFAQSTVTRSPRPKAIKFRVGQVIKHKTYGYRGVIIGWDCSCKAPSTWIKALYGEDRSQLDLPHYLILLDVRDRPDNQMTYVSEEKLSAFTNVNIINPKTWDYFDFYDGAQFHMRPSMHQVYPHD